MAITAAAGAAAGTSPPAPAVQSDSRDDGAKVLVGTGASGATTGTLVTVTLSGNYSSGVDEPAVPKVTYSVTYPSLAAAAAGIVLTSITTRQLVFSCQAALPGGLPATSGGVQIDFAVSA